MKLTWTRSPYDAVKDAFTPKEGPFETDMAELLFVEMGRDALMPKWFGVVPPFRILRDTFSEDSTVYYNVMYEWLPIQLTQEDFNDLLDRVRTHPEWGIEIEFPHESEKDWSHWALVRAMRKVGPKVKLGPVIEAVMKRSSEAGLEALNEAQRCVYAVCDFHTTVEMEGMVGCLHSSLGSHAALVISSFRRIGATQPAELLAEVYAIFGSGGIPVDTRTRREAINALSRKQILRIEGLGGQIIGLNDEYGDKLDLFILVNLTECCQGTSVSPKSILRGGADPMPT